MESRSIEIHFTENSVQYISHSLYQEKLSKF